MPYSAGPAHRSATREATRRERPLGAVGDARRPRRSWRFPTSAQEAGRSTRRWSSHAGSSARSFASPTGSGISASSARRRCSRASSLRSPPRPRGGFRSWPRWAGIGLAGLVCAMLLVPAVLLQVGLRDATEPWYFTNDSTYQIELAGDLVLDGHDPYGHDYDGSGLERFYPAAHDQLPEYAARFDHFAYFPGVALTAAAWRLAPSPFDDYRIFVLLATLALLPAALLFPGALHVRLAAGAALAANPLIVHGAWFGTADAPALLALVLAFALLDSRAPRLGRREPGRRAGAEAVRARRRALLRRHAADDRRPAPRLLPSGRGLRRRLPRHRAAVPRRRSGRALGRHGRLRREHLPDHRLRAVGAPAQRRADRRTASTITRSCRSLSPSGCR